MKYGRWYEPWHVSYGRNLLERAKSWRFGEPKDKYRGEHVTELPDLYAVDGNGTEAIYTAYVPKAYCSASMVPVMWLVSSQWGEVLRIEDRWWYWVRLADARHIQVDDLVERWQGTNRTSREAPASQLNEGVPQFRVELSEYNWRDLWQGKSVRFQHLLLPTDREYAYWQQKLDTVYETLRGLDNELKLRIWRASGEQPDALDTFRQRVIKQIEADEKRYWWVADMCGSI